VAASFGPGARFKKIPSSSPPELLGTGDHLVMTPRAGHLDLDLRFTGRDGLRFATPLTINHLDFRKIREQSGPGTTSVEAVSTLRVGSLDLQPLGGGETVPVDVKRHQEIAFAGLRGDITGLALGEENLELTFRGRTDDVTSNELEGDTVDLMPTWSQTPWVLRAGAGLGALLAALGAFGQVGGLWLWSAQRRTVRFDDDPRDD
jgi:hypothetical protein